MTDVVQTIPLSKEDLRHDLKIDQGGADRVKKYLKIDPNTEAISAHIFEIDPKEAEKGGIGYLTKLGMGKNVAKVTHEHVVAAGKSGVVTPAKTGNRWKYTIYCYEFGNGSCGCEVHTPDGGGYSCSC